jgi:hypothetical protein
MNNRGKENRMSGDISKHRQNSGDHDPKLGKQLDQSTKKPDTWRRELGNANKENTQNESPDTGKLGDTPTRKLESTTTSKLGTPEWRQKQLDDLWQGLGRKRKADELELDPSGLPTKQIRTEVTKKQDIKRIAEVPKDENQPPSPLSPEQKAKDRKNEMLPMDRMRLLGQREPFRPIIPRNN